MVANCKIVAQAERINPYEINSPMVSVVVCVTHHWQFGGSYGLNLPGGPTQCPIGRIEEATEEGLKRIAEAQGG